MIKYNKLKQMLIKEAAIAAGAIFVLGGAAIAVSSFATASDEDLQAANSSLLSLSSQIQDMERKKDIISSSGKKFEELQKRIQSDEFTLDPLNAQEKLNALRKEFRLGEPKVEFFPEADLSGPAYDQYPAVSLSSRNVKFMCKAMTDMHIYSFMEALKTRFPGIIKIKKVVITRSSEAGQEILEQIMLGQEPELVTAEIEFLWLGIRFKDDSVAGGL